MLTQKRFANGIKIIVKDSLEDGNEEIETFQEYFKENSWPPTMSKTKTLKGLQMFIDEELPTPDPGEVMVDMMLMQSRKPLKFSKKRKGLLKKLKKLIEDSKDNDCPHEDLGIAAFMHGGGFTPNIGVPELICKTCGLNISLFSGIIPQEYGIKISKPNLKKLNAWANDRLNNQSYEDKSTHVLSANHITKNPLMAYKNTVKWEEEVPVKILNPDKATSKTGA
jgi:hypothetical protein